MRIKRCYRCNERKPVDQFGFYRDKTGARYANSKCRVCSRSRLKEWKKANPARVAEQKKEWEAKNPGYARQYRLSKNGWSEEEYQKILKKQEGKCAICRDSRNLLFADHDHKTGKSRGLLCNSCNTALGFFEKYDYSLFATYLRKYQ